MPHLFASPLHFLCLLLSSVVLVPCMFQSHHSSLVKCVLTSKQATHSPIFETEFIWRDSINAVNEAQALEFGGDSFIFPFQTFPCWVWNASESFTISDIAVCILLREVEMLYFQADSQGGWQDSVLLCLLDCWPQFLVTCASRRAPCFS